MACKCNRNLTKTIVLKTLTLPTLAQLSIIEEICLFSANRSDTMTKYCMAERHSFSASYRQKNWRMI